MAKMQGVVVVNTERCKGCNLCVVIFALSLVRLTYSNYIQGRSTIKVTISFI